MKNGFYSFFRAKTWIVLYMKSNYRVFAGKRMQFLYWGLTDSVEPFIL
jgi:hypothetical protein